MVIPKLWAVVSPRAVLAFSPERDIRVTKPLAVTLRRTRNARRYMGVSDWEIRPVVVGEKES